MTSSLAHTRTLQDRTLRQPSSNPVISFIEKRSMAFWLTHFDYFPMSIVKGAADMKFDRSKQYVFAVHPHG